jgi:D-glycero-beta-D-manno-heptose 1-phosphate adenylyltransferase
VTELTILEALECRKGKKLVFTNGVFDILHAGHVTYLKSARELGDLLIVGLNSDESVRMLGKGPDRPVNSTEDRVTVLAALRCVDGVVVFTEKTPERLIELLKPEIHVKGGDYKVEDLPESELVHSYGGEVIILPLLPGLSTTLTLQALQQD